MKKQVTFEREKRKTSKREKQATIEKEKQKISIWGKQATFEGENGKYLNGKTGNIQKEKTEKKGNI